MAFQYSVFGLAVRSDQRLPRLRPPRHGFETPDVEILLDSQDAFSRLDDHDWSVFRKSPVKTNEGLPLLEFLQAPASGLFWFAYADGSDLAVNDSVSRVWVRWRQPNQLDDVAAYLLGPVLGFILRLHGRLVLHASAAVVDGTVVAFAGPGGSGKSTTAAYFALRGFPVVTDDIVVLRETSEGEIVVEPDSPIIRLWPQSSELLFGSKDALPRLSETWDKCFLDLESRGYPVAQGGQVLGAVYVFDHEPAKGATLELSGLVGGQALVALLANVYSTLDHDPRMGAAEFDLLSRLVGRIEVRRCRQPEERVAPAVVCDQVLADRRRSRERSVAHV